MNLFLRSLLMTAIAASVLSGKALAARGGGSMSGGDALIFGIGLNSSSQKDVNSWIDSTNSTGSKNLSSGYEFLAAYETRISGSIFALQFRPSYYTNSAKGGAIEASMSGLTFFPILRLYPLENSYMRIFLQTGLGYGQMTTKLSNSTTGGSGTYEGSAFGALGGMGAVFCITGTHCVQVEGIVRYLPIERNVGQASGSLGGNITRSSGELELNASDVATTFTGIMGSLSYVLNF